MQVGGALRYHRRDDVSCLAVRCIRHYCNSTKTVRTLSTILWYAVDGSMLPSVLQWQRTITNALLYRR